MLYRGTLALVLIAFSPSALAAQGAACLATVMPKVMEQINIADTSVVEEDAYIAQMFERELAWAKKQGDAKEAQAKVDDFAKILAAYRKCVAQQRNQIVQKLSSPKAPSSGDDLGEVIKEVRVPGNPPVIKEQFQQPETAEDFASLMILKINRIVKSCRQLANQIPYVDEESRDMSKLAQDDINKSLRTLQRQAYQYNALASKPNTAAICPWPDSSQAPKVIPEKQAQDFSYPTAVQ
jgi:hypothetical protein